MMKKILTIALALMMILSLAACGGSGSDVSALKESYSSLATAYNDMIALATENGWDQDVDFATTLNEISAQISSVKPVIEDPADYTQEQIDEMTSGCDDLIDWTAEMYEVVSVPYEDAA